MNSVRKARLCLAREKPYLAHQSGKGDVPPEKKEMSHVYQLPRRPRPGPPLLAGAPDRNRQRRQKASRAARASPESQPHIAGLDPARTGQAAVGARRETGAAARGLPAAILRLRKLRARGDALAWPRKTRGRRVCSNRWKAAVSAAPFDIG